MKAEEGGKVVRTCILCLIKHHTVKTIGDVEVCLQWFLTWKLNGGEWSASLPAALLPSKDPSVII